MAWATDPQVFGCLGFAAQASVSDNDAASSVPRFCYLLLLVGCCWFVGWSDPLYQTTLAFVRHKSPIHYNFLLYGSCAAVIRDRSSVILVKNLVEEGQRRRTDVDGQTEGRTTTEGTTVRADGQGDDDDWIRRGKGTGG